MYRRALAVAGGLVCLIIFLGAPALAKKKSVDAAAVSFQKEIPKEQRVEQAVNRLTFGPRPGDLARVRAIGLKKWINLQLHPNRIAENPALLEKLKGLDSLSMSSRELAQNYPPPRIAKLQEGPRKTEGPQAVARDLIEGKLLRAIYSNRQLEEVLTDFWFNHFNVFLDKGADRYLVTAYERDVIRPGVLGKFRDLLEATAKSPAMLFYLDNWQSVGDTAMRGRPLRRGLNENYGRELLELHTLGVDGGYTQKDVTEVARCFTGWTIRQPQQGGEFIFNPKAHDSGEKTVLGVKIPAGGGIEDGERVLDIVSRSPATARFISRKLAARFVADDPPAALVDRMAETFLKTGGDLRAVMRAMLEAKEFWSAGAYRAKIKSPLELVASAARAVNADVNAAFALNQQLAQLGEPLYRKLEPTGYSNSGKEWMNSAGLLARMNFALSLVNNRVVGVKVATDAAEGIALGAPEFQKH